MINEWLLSYYLADILHIYYFLEGVRFSTYSMFVSILK